MRKSIDSLEITIYVALIFFNFCLHLLWRAIRFLKSEKLWRSILSFVGSCLWALVGKWMIVARR